MRDPKGGLQGQLTHLLRHFLEQVGRDVLSAVIDRRKDLEQLEHVLHTVTHEGFALAGLHHALTQRLHERVDLAAFALPDDHPEELSRVGERLEMVAAVAQDVENLDHAPVLELPEIGADRGTGDGEGLADLLSGDGLLGQVEKRDDLGTRTVDAPDAAHLSPADYELLHDRCQFHHLALLSVYTEITAIGSVVKRSAAGSAGRSREGLDRLHET